MDIKEKMNRLVSKGIILDWILENVDENNEVNKTSRFRNTERLTIYFHDDEKLVIDTICSGSAENTIILVS
jgi:hypothetical protein